MVRLLKKQKPPTIQIDVHEYINIHFSYIRLSLYIAALGPSGVGPPTSSFCLRRVYIYIYIYNKQVYYICIYCWGRRLDRRGNIEAVKHVFDALQPRRSPGGATPLWVATGPGLAHSSTLRHLGHLSSKQNVDI